MAEVIIKDFIRGYFPAVDPRMSLLRAVDVLLKNKLEGLPVVDSKSEVVGILTEKDLVLQGSVHLPTFLKLLQEFHVYAGDNESIRPDIEKILEMKVEDVMNRNPKVILETTPLEEAWNLFNDSDINLIIVVDAMKKLVGVLSRRDLIKLMGSPSVSLKNGGGERQAEKNVANFLKDFESQFVVVSKFRTKHWVLMSALFAIIGFIIAFAFIVRVK